MDKKIIDLKPTLGGYVDIVTLCDGQEGGFIVNADYAEDLIRIMVDEDGYIVER